MGRLNSFARTVQLFPWPAHKLALYLSYLPLLLLVSLVASGCYESWVIHSSSCLDQLTPASKLSHVQNIHNMCLAAPIWHSNDIISFLYVTVKCFHGNGYENCCWLPVHFLPLHKQCTCAHARARPHVYYLKGILLHVCCIFSSVLAPIRRFLLCVCTHTCTCVYCIVFHSMCACNNHGGLTNSFLQVYLKTSLLRIPLK